MHHCTCLSFWMLWVSISASNPPSVVPTWHTIAWAIAKPNFYSDVHLFLCMAAVSWSISHAFGMIWKFYDKFLDVLSGCVLSWQISYHSSPISSDSADPDSDQPKKFPLFGHLFTGIKPWWFPSRSKKYLDNPWSVYLGQFSQNDSVTYFVRVEDIIISTC